jgi:hypothetical protein
MGLFRTYQQQQQQQNITNKIMFVTAIVLSHEYKGCHTLLQIVNSADENHM